MSNMTKNLRNWDEITTNEAYMLSQAEFRGMVIQALSDIRSDIQELKADRNAKNYISYAVAAIVGAISGMFGGNVK